MLPNTPQQTPLVRPKGFAAAPKAADRLLEALTKNPKATSIALAVLLMATALAWAGIAVGQSRAKAAGHALTQAFAIKDALSHDLLAERAAARKEALAAAAASGSKDDGDDDDDVRDDGDDDDAAGEAEDGQVPQFATQAARNQAAHEAFAALARKHPGTLGTLAALEAIAVAPAHEGLAIEAQGPAAQQASELLGAAARTLPSHNPLLAVAALREAQLAEDAGDTAAALAACDRAIAAQQLFLGDEVRLIKARLLMGKNDLEGARAALEDVQNTYPQSALSDELRIQLAALQALVAQAPAPPAAAHAAG